MQKLSKAAFPAALLLVCSVAVSFGLRSKKTSVNGIGWYNSFEEAQVEAKRTKKPILFLSMFGRIDEAMPCANARTLRATLFKDPEFKKLVTEEVIPAWEMVRAVPHIEIDLGDGKKVTRTVRGNAVMYLCNSDGKVIDAYPGIYTTQDFMPMVHESIKELANADSKTVLKYHQDRGGFVPAVGITASKMVLEAPTLDLIGAPSIAGEPGRLQPSGSPAKQRFAEAARQLTDLSLTPRRLDLAVPVAVPGATTKSVTPAQILQADSQRNIQFVRPVIHLYMASEDQLPTPAQARDAILENVLKIPYKDPYFGLKDVLMPGTPN